MSLPAFTVFDVETTGLSPDKGHRIVEIAGIRIEQGVIVEEKTFVSLVNPERDIPYEARQVNKINPEDVKTAPTIDTVLPEFLTFAQNSLLVAHNAEFDMSFLENEKQCCWGYMEFPECLCTLKLSRNLYPQEFWHNLDAVGKRFNLQLPEARHRALPDVILTAQALLKMLEAGKISSLDELRRRASLSAKMAPKPMLVKKR